MANPAYIDTETGAISVTEAWVPLLTCTPTGTKLCQLVSVNDGSTLDWSQYMDLVVIAAAQSVGTVYDGDGILGYFNNDTTSSYDVQFFAGKGGSLYTSRQTTAYMSLGNSLSTRVDSAISTSLIWHIFDINSGKYKTSISQWAATRDSTATWTVGLYSHTWKNQAAITEIDFNMENANYGTGCVISLFGVLPRMVS
tara:strand:+ start:62 stop:652 length:591 start_codon:yes stop_codon:yes gene_type:complete